MPQSPAARHGFRCGRARRIAEVSHRSAALPGTIDPHGASAPPAESRRDTPTPKPGRRVPPTPIRTCTRCPPNRLQQGPGDHRSTHLFAGSEYRTRARSGITGSNRPTHPPGRRRAVGHRTRAAARMAGRYRTVAIPPPRFGCGPVASIGRPVHAPMVREPYVSFTRAATKRCRAGANRLKWYWRWASGVTGTMSRWRSTARTMRSATLSGP